MDKRLLEAIEKDDRYEAAKALKAGAEDIEFAFMKALMRGNADMVGLLLDHGADPNTEMSDAYQYQKYSISPLMIAVWKGYEEVVKLLLVRGANPNCEHRFGKADDGVGEITALGEAIENGSVKIVEMLLDAGASPYGVYAGEPWGRYSMEFLDAYEWAEREGTREISDFLEERRKATRQRAIEAGTLTEETQTEETESAPLYESAETTAEAAPADANEVDNEYDSTEAEWLGCGDGDLSHAISLLRGDALKQRKLFLAGCGWARRVWERLGRRSRTAIEVFERFGDQEAAIDGFFADLLQQFLPFNVFAYVLQAHLGNNEKDAASPLGEFFSAMLLAEGAWEAATSYMNAPPEEGQPDAETYIVLPARAVFSLSRGAYVDASDELYFASSGDKAEYQAQCDILRDVFGNSVRPVSIEASWLSQNEGAVEKIAQSIYDERAFDRLPELADALEKSGCHNERILSHCRSEGEHVRGCWVIDLLLSKERLAFPLGAQMPLAFRPEQAA